MGENSAIAWTTHTFSPVWGCSAVSAECKNCYAEAWATRFGHRCWGRNPRRTFGDEHWADPLKWDRIAEKAGKRARVFCGSMCDVFEDAPGLDEQRTRLWKLIEVTPSLDWLLLTKRPENIEHMMPFIQIGGSLVERFINVWLGTTVGCKASLPRVDELRRLPATVHFLSCEPLLEDLGEINLRGISWVIAGGESGPHARPCAIEWLLCLRDQCKTAGVPYFLKQLGAMAVSVERACDTDEEAKEMFGYNSRWLWSAKLKDRAGANPEEWPLEYRVRQFPEVTP